METSNARPTFLTILCVLTFIASAWGIYKGFANYLSADSIAGITQSAMDEAKDQIENAGSRTAEAVIDSIANSISPDKIKKNGIGEIVSSILCLVGAFLMWNLNKKGYWVYVVGTVVGVAVPMVVNGGLVGMAAGGAMAFFGIVFCVLYGLNLKHMS